MQLLSANIGKKRTQPKGDGLETTGIYKMPASGVVNITPSGIEQDFIGDQKNHGGPDQAIYVYGTADYDWWARELGKTLEPGTFGENLTVSELESGPLSIGDRLRVGAVTLEVTAPRTPCSTLAARMGDPKFAEKYRHAERPGVYCRVVEPGTVQAGDEALRVPCVGETVSVLEMFRIHFQRDKDEATLRRILRATISVRAKASLEADLEKALARREA
ncbi:MAG: MOSC domain-containing protein [Chloroflexota bacterium]